MDPKSAETSLLEYGILGGAVLVLGYVVIYLFRRYDRRELEIVAERKAMDAERAAWLLEKAALKLEYEVRHREIVEDAASELSKAADAQSHMLEKLTDKLVVGPKGRY